MSLMNSSSNETLLVLDGVHVSILGSIKRVKSRAFSKLCTGGSLK